MKNNQILLDDWKMELNCIDQEIMLECIQLNYPEEINIQYYQIDENCGYWVVKDLFKNFPLFVEIAKLSPVFPPMSQYGLNCFLKQTLPSIQIENIKKFLTNFTFQYLNPKCDFLTFSDYGNIFKYGKIQTQKVGMLPHADSLNSNSKAIVAANLWLSEGNNGGTAFWKYKDNYYSNDNYLKYLASMPEKIRYYDNYEGDDYLEKIGECPAEYGTLTIYDPNLLHSPVITKDPNHLRWSYALIGLHLID